MVSKLTFTSRRRQARAGTSLVEALVAIGVTGLIMLALVSLSMVSGRSFAAFANYIDLDSANRTAMDTLTRDLRECNRVVSFSETQLVIEDSDGFNITYFYNRDVKESVDKAQKALGPAMTLVLGGLLAFVIWAVLGPVYDILGKLKF